MTLSQDGELKTPERHMPVGKRQSLNLAFLDAPARFVRGLRPSRHVHGADPDLKEEYPTYKVFQRHWFYTLEPTLRSTPLTLAWRTRAPPSPWRRGVRTAAVAIGDSTFTHSGMRPWIASTKTPTSPSSSPTTKPPP